MDSLREKLPAGGFSKDSAALITNVSEDQVQMLITYRPGVSGIAGALKDKWIPLSVL